MHRVIQIVSLTESQVSYDAMYRKIAALGHPIDFTKWKFREEISGY